MKKLRLFLQLIFTKLIKNLQKKYDRELIINFDTDYEVDVEITIYDGYIE